MTPITLLFYLRLAAGALALVASVAAVPILALLAARIAARVTGAADHPALARIRGAWAESVSESAYGRPPGPDDLVVPTPPHAAVPEAQEREHLREVPAAAGRVSGQIPLGLGAAAGFVAAALLAHPESLGPLVAVPLGFLSLVLVVVGGALLASQTSRAAIRAVLARATGAAPPRARVVFGLALAGCGWSLAGELRWVLAPMTLDASGAPIVILWTYIARPSFVIWAVGRAAMVAGAVALLRARYAGTLAYTAGFILVFAPSLAGLAAHASSLRRLAELAVQVVALLLAWRHVRPGTSPAPRLDPA